MSALNRCSLRLVPLRQCIKSQRHASTTHLPKLVQPTLWQSIIPKYFRPSPEPINNGKVSEPSHQEKRGWLSHPSTQLIVLGLLAGSQAIQILQLKTGTKDQRAIVDEKLRTLQEVIQKVKNGEDVDIKRELGTGDPAAEKEWSQVIDQISDEMLWLQGSNKSKQRKRSIKSARDKEQQSDVTVEPATETLSTRGFF